MAKSIKDVDEETRRIVNEAVTKKTLTRPVLASARTRPYVGSEKAEDHEVHEEIYVD